MPYNNDTIQNALILMPDKHMGNLIVSLFAITSLLEFYRDKAVFLVVDEAYREIVETLPGVHQYLFYPRKALRSLPALKRAAAFYRYVARLRNLSADIAIDLEGRQVSSMLTLASGAPLRVGRSSAKRHRAYNIKVRLSKHKHKLYNYTEVAAAVGCTHINKAICLRAADKNKKSLAHILKKEGVEENKPMVCIHPGAGKVYKRWKSEGFAEIADWLIAEGYQSIIVGSVAEADKIREIRSLQHNPSFYLNEKLSLGELLALFEKCACFIGNDSGPMHLASSVGIPVIALFGTAKERRWSPLTEKSAVLRGDKPCGECVRNECKHGFKCVNAVSPQEVRQSFTALLEAP